MLTSTCHALPSAWTTRSSIGRLQLTDHHNVTILANNNCRHSQSHTTGLHTQYTHVAQMYTDFASTSWPVADNTGSTQTDRF